MTCNPKSEANRLTAQRHPEVAVGQIWRDDENRLNYRVVGFAKNGWPAVKLLPNGQHSEMVNPSWFKVWRCTSVEG